MELELVEGVSFERVNDYFFGIFRRGSCVIWFVYIFVVVNIFSNGVGKDYGDILIILLMI